MCCGRTQENEYGLLGLLKIIRMTDLDLNTLALGQDLTTLGLNLNSQEPNLYATFGSPWADPPLTREPDYILPACYYTQPPAFKREHLSKFSLRTLFYIFYMVRHPSGRSPARPPSLRLPFRRGPG